MSAGNFFIFVHTSYWMLGWLEAGLLRPELTPDPDLGSVGARLEVMRWYRVYTTRQLPPTISRSLFGIVLGNILILQKHWIT